MLRPDSFALARHNDANELDDVRRSPRAMLTAGAVCLTGEATLPLPLPPAPWLRAAVSAREAVRAMGVTEQRAADAEDGAEPTRFVVDLGHYRDRRNEALVSLRALGLALEEAGHLASHAVRLMAARIDLHGADVDLRGYVAALAELVEEAGA